MKSLLFYLLSISALLFGCSNPVEIREVINVKRVVDGDTFWINDGSKKGVKVRIIGIDTPELAKNGKPGEFYSEEAKNFLVQLIANKQVALSYDVEKKDKYGRTLAYVYVDDTVFVNAELIKGGYARTLRIPPNVKKSNYLQHLERKAKRENLGIWQK